MEASEIDSSATAMWNYMKMNHPLTKADCIFVLGSHDTRVANHAVDLFLQGYAPYIIFSGGLGRLTEGVFAKPEAEIFADIARGRGVPEDNIIIENQSTNTGQNIDFTRKLLAERNLDFKSFILVQKPYMERRSFATFKKRWPEMEIIVTSPSLSYDEYPTSDISKEEMINVMVGDLQRIKIYPAKGFQISQDIPDDVWSAYSSLVAAGFDTHVLKD